MSYRAWAVLSNKYNYKALKTLKTASKWTMNQLLTKPGGFHKDSMDWKKKSECAVGHRTNPFPKCNTVKSYDDGSRKF